MKHLFLIFILTVLTSIVYSQDCTSVHLLEAGDVQVRIQGPETDECFEFYLNDKLITPNQVGELAFNIVSEDYRINDSVLLIKGKVIMANGTEIKKRMSLPDGYKSHLFVIKAKKKGKYALRRKLSGMIPTEAKLAEREAEKKEFMDEHNRKVEEGKREREAQRAADDAKWDADRAEEKRAMKERMDSHEGAKLSEYKDTVQGRQGADHKLIEGANHELIKGADHKLIEGAKYNEVEAIKGKDEQLIKEQSDSFSGQTETFGGSAFDDDKDNVQDSGNESAVNPSDILNPNGESVDLNMRLLYEGKPVEKTHLTLEINNVVLGSGTTDAAGNLLITTSKLVDMNTAFRLTGKKGEFSWMFGGIQLLDFPPKTTKIEMAFIIRTLSEDMNTSPEVLSRSWGFLMNE